MSFMNRKSFFSASLFLLLSVNLSAQSSPLQVGINYYNNGDYENALASFEAAKVNQSENTRLVIAVYTAKINIDKYPSSQEIARESINQLIPIEKAVGASNVKGLNSLYIATKIHCYAILNDWENVNKEYNKLSNPDELSSYFAAVGFYKNAFYNQAESILKKLNLFEAKLLLANIYAHKSNYIEAEEIYKSLYASDKLTGTNLLDFANILYHQKKYDESLLMCDQSNVPHSCYIQGLCYYSKADYQKARQKLDLYLNNFADQYGYKDNAEVYIYNCDYMLGNYSKAYTEFSKFADVTLDVNLCRLSLEKGAQAGILYKNYKGAAELAKRLISVSIEKEEKEKAVLLCSDIYSQSGDYDSAIALLNDYTHDKSDFALQCSYRIARFYEEKGQYQKADGIYGLICIEYSTNPLSEDVMYRRGELFYSFGEYKTSAERFLRYINRYPSGKYIESAYYYCAECELNLGENDKCIMHNKTLLAKNPNSVYAYGAYRNLLQAYENLSSVDEALAVADIITKNYGKQAESDGVQGKKTLLQEMKKGYSKDLALKKSEFTQAGATGTKEGRLIGYELVGLYDKNGFEDEAKNLSERLYMQISKIDSDEYFLAAENSFYFAKNNQGLKAAQIYLKAAEIFRKSGTKGDERAASSLYSATDCFIFAEQNADAKATAQTLKQLYPKSKYAENVDALF